MEAAKNKMMVLIEKLLDQYPNTEGQISDSIKIIREMQARLQEELRISACLHEVQAKAQEADEKKDHVREQSLGIEKELLVKAQELAVILSTAEIPGSVNAPPVLKKLRDAKREAAHALKESDEIKNTDGLIGLAKQKATQAIHFAKTKAAEMELSMAINELGRTIIESDFVEGLRDTTTNSIIDSIMSSKKEMKSLAAQNDKLDEEYRSAVKEIISRTGCNDDLSFKDVQEMYQINELLLEHRSALKQYQHKMDDAAATLISQIRNNPDTATQADLEMISEIHKDVLALSSVTSSMVENLKKTL